jgi:hypothetical protein
MKLLLLRVAMSLLLGLSAGAAQAASCPADAAKASYAIWYAGQLTMKVEATGTHPCGRQMTCTGGSTKRRVERICRWL